MEDFDYVGKPDGYKMGEREKLLVAGHSFNTSWSRRGENMGNVGVNIETGQVRLIYNLMLRRHFLRIENN
ncbi:MAG: hypothetical protein PHH59_16490 [Methylovulum sp.]|uniref:hypothetical protein n=1 Tax=Methylovulum sp. TaxID=1916980 RepID=UPI002620BCCC|nr:hypothetical protein [Methylovulum sp.]MDD2725600.1 hypothetical protein [Methylovulum sp.]MDD5125653.1 hypothetical protein [Methylovulum sp.]